MKLILVKISSLSVYAAFSFTNSADAEANHQLIVEPGVWEAVQLERERRRTFMEKHHIKAFPTNIESNPFASKVICGECGEPFGRKKWITRQGSPRSVWQCNARYKVKGVLGCDNRHIDESTLETAYVKAWGKLMEQKENCQTKWERQLKGKNPLVAYRAKTMMEYSQKEITEFDTEQMHQTLECILIYETGKLKVRFLDGETVTIG